MALKDITLGQFFPGTSPIHKLDARTKILLSGIYIVGLFLCSNLIAYALAFALLALVVKLSGISPRMLQRSLKPLVVILAFTCLLNVFYTPGTVLVQLWIFRITKEGIFQALYMLLRIVLLVASTSMLTYTTSPINLTDGFERLLSPLKKFGVPVHEFSMMMSLALRFIPTLIEETDKIMSAQKSRGADFETGSLLDRARALIPVLVPLFVSAFRRADELATAMECRLYHGGAGRTKLHTPKMVQSDRNALVCGAAFMAAVIVLRVI